MTKTLALIAALGLVVSAPVFAAEEAAAKLGFNDPRAHPIAPEVVRLTQIILKRHPGQRAQLAHTPSRSIRI